MKSYLYSVSDGQFSFEFEAPLMHKEEDFITFYEYSQELDETFENRIQVKLIDHKEEIVHCVGFTE